MLNLSNITVCDISLICTIGRVQISLFRRELSEYETEIAIQELEKNFINDV